MDIKINVVVAELIVHDTAEMQSSTVLKM